MRWIPDRSGRFGRRPFYENFEIENECESVVSEFLLEARGEVRYPLSTDDLTLLVERFADLNMYADLRDEGEEVEGMTTFVPGRRPRVEIDERLATDDRRENRLRTTIAHEFGHVRLHNILFQNLTGTLPLFGDVRAEVQRCKRDGIVAAAATDWMEFQAGYVCTALLAPKRKILDLLSMIVGSPAVIQPDDALAQLCSSAVAEAFGISLDAARVRLRTVGAIGASAAQRGLFAT